MFIHSVETPRKVKIKFSGDSNINGNVISIITGVNGSGKTDILATIADVFHGAIQSTNGARIDWSRTKYGEIQHAYSLTPGSRYSRGRLRLIAQTFSPFSRFPGIELDRDYKETSIHARGHAEEEEYVCIGFDLHSNINIRNLSKIIIENGIIRLSEEPKAAKVAFDVLEDLGFKNGINLVYHSDKRLSSLLEKGFDINLINDLFLNLLINDEFKIPGDRYIYRNAPNYRLKKYINSNSPSYAAEMFSLAVGIVLKYISPVVKDEIFKTRIFDYHSFQSRQSMSSEYSVLQAFSFLHRLGFLKLEGCIFHPYEGMPLDITQTSSGQQQMLCSIFGLSAALEDDSLILIDEPELSLHPRWQINFIKHLCTALSSFVNCHVIIATHSPLIAQGGMNQGAEIISLSSKDSEITSDYRYFDNKKSVEELLLNVFKTPIPNSLFISEEIFFLISKAETGDVCERNKSLTRLNEYLSIYRQHGDGGIETIKIIEKAIRLIKNW